MRRNDEYRAIKTLDELRRKIVSTERELLVRERRLREDYEEVSRIFTFDYQVERTAERFDGLRKSVESMFSGASLVSTFINGFRDRLNKARNTPPEPYTPPTVEIEEEVVSE